MREILFRGKRTDNGEWIEGCLITSEFCSSEYSIGYLSSELHHIDEEDVIPKTVGQYTGLTDKNGKKIFEGDVVRCSSIHDNIVFIAVVEFGNPNGIYNWGWQLRHILGDKANTDILLWCETELDGVYAEIIGNIHDNPELLEVE